MIHVDSPRLSPFVDGGDGSVFSPIYILNEI